MEQNTITFLSRKQKHMGSHKIFEAIYSPVNYRSKLKIPFLSKKRSQLISAINETSLDTSSFLRNRFFSYFL